MKKVLLLVALVALMATTSFAAISGTAHDFTSGTYNFTTEICAPCHTPHGGAILSGAPLWAHTVSTATYTTYTGVNMNASAAGGPGTVSQLCLSCHDGTVALDSFIGSATATSFITGRANLGTDLTNDHPIGMDYTTATASADGELVNPSAAGTSGLGGTIAADMLYTNKVECASCHDVHGKVGITSLLIKSNSGSGLCLTCHVK